MLKKSVPRLVTVNVGFDGAKRNQSTFRTMKNDISFLFPIPIVLFVISSTIAGLVDKPAEVWART